MILLDTDHITVLRYPETSNHAALVARMETPTPQGYGTTVITVEEQLRGWLALINRLHDVRKQIPVYQRLAKLFEFFSKWQIVLFDELAANEFQRLRKARLRIGTQDLKIAAIALVRNATLLSANLRDFRRIPNLAVESWLA